MVRSLARTGVFTVMALGVAAAASAQVVQSVQIGVGGFFPRGPEVRPDNDVLVKDLTNVNPMLFFISDFRGATLSGEWNIGFGRNVEVGLGTGYFRRTVPSIYADVTFPDGREIEQTLRLRVIPVTAVVRFLPLGNPAGFQPYVGAGVSALSFRYSEIGSFVDDFDSSIFNARFITSGTAAGPVLLGGFRAPVGGDIYAFTTELRYQWGKGSLPTDFLGNQVDLGGLHLNFGVLVRF